MDSDLPLPLLPLMVEHVPAALKVVLGQEGVPFEAQAYDTARGRFVLYDSAMGTPRLLAGQEAIDVATLRDHWDEDPYRALSDEQAARHEWKIGHWRLREEIARVDRRAIRKKLLTQLQALVEGAGGVWLRVAPYPFPYRSVFGLRLDHDRYDADDFQSIMQQIRGREDAVSHYVCGSSYEAHPAALEQLRGMDVGGHGYWHHTYRSRRENEENIGRGLDVLRSAGLKPSGFVAPHGRFHRGLLLALEALGIRHSSEFGFAYDDLPFCPAGSPVLQIPVHPVCLGLFLDAVKGRSNSSLQAATATATRYWQEVARAKYQQGEPIFLYCHPDGRLGRHPEVLTELWKTLDRFSGLWRTNLSTFAEWWRARQQVELQLFRTGDQYTLIFHRPAHQFRFGVEFCRGERFALVPVDVPVVRFTQATLAFEQRKGPGVPRAMRLDEAHSWRDRVRREIDWERVTPPHHIRDRSWRGWTKWMLRQVMSHSEQQP